MNEDSGFTLFTDTNSISKGENGVKILKDYQQINNQGRETSIGLLVLSTLNRYGY